MLPAKKKIASMTALKMEYAKETTSVTVLWAGKQKIAPFPFVSITVITKENV